MAQHLYPNGLTPALFLSRTAHHFLDAELRLTVIFTVRWVSWEG